MSSSYIYVIEAINTGFVKIGKANSPEDRTKELQTGSYAPLRLVCKFKTTNVFEMERKIHDSLEEYRIRGEWFELTPIQAATSVKTIIDAEKPPRKTFSSRPSAKGLGVFVGVLIFLFVTASLAFQWGIYFSISPDLFLFLVTFCCCVLLLLFLLVRRVVYSEGWSCYKCGKSFKTQEALRGHISNKHWSKQPKLIRKLLRRIFC